MDKVYLIASTLADTGKGWLTASVASLVGGQLIKIDPVLNSLYVPRDAKNIDAALVSTDVPTYRELGLDIHPEAIIRSGDILYEFLQSIRKPIDKFEPYTVKRMTFADASKFFAGKLEDLVRKYGYDMPVIEMGGSVDDPELPYLADGVRNFANFNGAELNVILLSYFTNSDDKNHAVKVNEVVSGVKKTADVYWREPSYVFVRNRTRHKLSEDEIQYHISKIALRTHIPPERIIFEPEFDTPAELRNYIRSLNIFETRMLLEVVAGNTRLKQK